MATTITLDDKIVDGLTAVSGIDSVRDAVTTAVPEYTKMQAAKKLMAELKKGEDSAERYGWITEKEMDAEFGSIE
jgi:Arc/MetJ family transcription regulator